MKLYPLHLKDFYKSDHRSQYPKGTELVNANFTPRSVKHAAKAAHVDERIVFAGLQYFIKYVLMDVWVEGFFKQPKDKVAARYKRRLDTSLGASRPVDIAHIEKLHDLGYLPISIRALPEGAATNARCPWFTVENTILSVDYSWLTNFLETTLSNYVWKCSESATTAYKYKQLLTWYAQATGGDLLAVQFQAHDFSYRGMNTASDAATSGVGHLFSFWGTDTIPAIDLLEDYYNANAEKEPVGLSVAATEHSVMCMGGCEEGQEFNTFKRLITEIYPSGFVSIVSDTWDYWKVITEYLPQLRDTIMARAGGALGDRVVIRPDSGDPVKIIVGDPDAPEGSPERKGTIECLWDTFSGTITSKGYKLLDPHIGLIYGDSITLNRAEQIVAGLMAKGFCSTNVVLGVGSYTYTYTTRDTHGMAVKATAGQINGKPVEIFKDPKTDGGMKKSAKGLLVVELKDGQYVMRDQASREDYENKNELKEVYRDGKLLVEHTLAEIRARIDANVKQAVGK